MVRPVQSDYTTIVLGNLARMLHPQLGAVRDDRETVSCGDAIPSGRKFAAVVDVLRRDSLLFDVVTLRDVNAPIVVTTGL